MTGRPKVLLYPRVSSQDQLGNNSLPTQHRAMAAYAERQGFEVWRTFEERGASAKSMNRPALQEMLAFVDEHPRRVHAVLCYDYSRIARNTADHLAIRARLDMHKVRLISVTQPVTDDPIGEFQEMLHASLARLDNRMRADRTKVGMVAASERGRWCHQAPVGYLNCGRNASPSLRFDPDRASLVEEAFERIASGQEPVAVHADLVGRGMTTRRRRPISRTAFYVLLRNPVYKGELRTKLGTSVGDWEAMVDSSTWDRVQSVVSRKDSRHPSLATRRQAGKRPYRRLRPGLELRGFLVCAECGRNLTGGVTKGYSYLHCPKGHVRGRATDIGDHFCRWLEAVRPNEAFLIRLSGEIRSVWAEQRITMSRRKDSEKRRLSELEAKLSRLNDGYLEGDVDRDTYRRLHASLKADLAAAAYRGVETGLVQLDLEAVLQFAECLLSRPARWWLDASPEDKVKVQKAIFPDGLEIDRNYRFSTRVSGPESMTYLLFGEGSSGMASPTGKDILYHFLKGAARRA